MQKDKSYQQMLDSNRAKMDAYKNLGEALAGGDEEKMANAFFRLLDAMKMGQSKPEQQTQTQGQAAGQGQGQGQGQSQTQGQSQDQGGQGSSSSQDPDLGSFGEEDIPTMPGLGKMTAEQQRAESSLEREARKRQATSKDKKAYADYVTKYVEQKSRRLVSALQDRLSFMACDASRKQVGYKSGRLTGKSCMRVATQDEQPFARKAAPKSAAKITLFIAHDVSGSMGHPTHEESNMFQAFCLVHALKTLQDVYPSIQVISVPWSTSAYCLTDENVGHSVNLDNFSGGTRMAPALRKIHGHEAYKEAIANKDAVIGVMITDGTGGDTDMQDSKRIVKKEMAATETWCCAVVGNVTYNEDGTITPNTLGQEKIWGKANTIACRTVHEAVNSISKTVQKCIAKAEAKRG